MIRPKLALFTFLLLFVLGVPAFGVISFATMEGVALRVGEIEISMERFDDAVKYAKEELAVKDFEGTYEAFDQEQSYMVIKSTALNQLIDGILIEDGASRDGVFVTEKMIRVEIEKLKKKFPSSTAFHRSIAEGGMTIADLKKNIRRQLIVEGLQKRLMASIVVSDEEIEAFYEKNIEIFVQPERETTLSQAKRNIRDFLLKEKGFAAFQEWLDNERQIIDIVINESLKEVMEEEPTSRFFRIQFMRSLS